MKKTKKIWKIICAKRWRIIESRRIYIIMFFNNAYQVYELMCL